MMASTEGGMDIEEVAANTPEKILKVAIDPISGMQPFHARRLAFGLGLEGKQVGAATKFMLAIYKAYIDFGLEPARDQSARRYRRRPDHRPRREDEFRR